MEGIEGSWCTFKFVWVVGGLYLEMLLDNVNVSGLSQNRHPDMPRRPLSTYMLFYMEKKDKVARENPGLEMVSTNYDEIAEM